MIFKSTIVDLNVFTSSKKIQILFRRHLNSKISFFYSQYRCRTLQFINKIIRNLNLYYIHERYRSAISIRCKKLNEID